MLKLATLIFPGNKMTTSNKPRLRFFEMAANQQHIVEADKYLYRQREPEFRLSVIGTGTIGQEHMRVASLLGRAQVHGIFDSSDHSMDVAIEQYAQFNKGKLIRYPDIASACGDPAVDAVMICTPNHTHFEVLKVALQCGKPIFLEKPMASTLIDAANIVELAAGYDNFIQIGLQYRYKAQYLEAFHEVHARKSLGPVHTISMSEYRPPFLDKVGQWNKFNANSGGTLLEKCCHYFDLMNLMAAARPARVFASGGQAVNFLDLEVAGERSDIDDHGFVIIEYDNGIRANFTLNMFSPDFYEEMIVVGEHARLVAKEQFNVQQQSLAKASVSVELGEQGASRTIETAYPRLIEQSGHHGATYFEHIAFLNQLQGIDSDAATVDDGFWSILVAAAAQQSMLTKTPVTIHDFLKQQGLSKFLKD